MFRRKVVSFTWGVSLILISLKRGRMSLGERVCYSTPPLGHLVLGTTAVGLVARAVWYLRVSISHTRCFKSFIKARRNVSKVPSKPDRRLPQSTLAIVANCHYCCLNASTVVQLGVAYRWLSRVLASQGGPIRVDQPFFARTHIETECLIGQRQYCRGYSTLRAGTW